MRIDEPESILVFRNGSIGNTLVALPAIRALKEQFPQAALSVILDNTGTELLRHVPFIDQIITYDKRGADRGFAAQLHFVRRLRKRRPTHAILFKRFFRNGLLAYLSGAEYRIGYMTDGKAPFLNKTILYDETLHIAQLNLNLLSLLGIEQQLTTYSIPFSEKDQIHTTQVLEQANVEQARFVVVHYGGSTTKPDFFPADRIQQLLQPLIDSGTNVVFIGAGPQEEALARETITQMGYGKLLMNLPVRIMAAVVSRARCFVGFNSGPAHIAAGVATPGVVIYRPDSGTENEIRKWRPLYDKLIPVVPPREQQEAEWSSFIEEARSKIAGFLPDVKLSS